MRSARVSRNFGAVHSDAAITAPFRLPVAGKLRAGVKVLTAAAEKHQDAVKLYEDGVRAGASFDDIEKQIKAIKGAPGYPLRPANSPYFTARQGDFAMPGAVQYLMDTYGEVRQGDPEKRLYTVPIVFPSEDVDLIFREQFEAWKATELSRWSQVNSISGNLDCMRRETVTPDRSAPARRWGGRAVVIDRACEPNDCHLFKSGDCKHVASLNFWIPGLLGAGTIEMTFTSIYASAGVFEAISLVKEALGRITGLHNGRPIFYLSKSFERKTRMNWKTGKPEKTDQWIIRLDATGLDMMEALASPASVPALPPSAAAAVPPIAHQVAAPMIAAAHQVAAAPTEGDSAADAKNVDVDALQSTVGGLRDRMGWTNQDLVDWVYAQSYASATPFTDAECLADMAEKLSPLADALAQQHATEDSKAGPASTEAADEFTMTELTKEEMDAAAAVADEQTEDDEEAPF